MALHWRIIVGLVLGALVGIAALEWDFREFVLNWFDPMGKIFLNLLKVIAVPLILASLIKGVSAVKDIRQLSSMGGKTVGLYLISTVLAVTIGLGIVNVMSPGTDFPPATQEALQEQFSQTVSQRQSTAQEVQSQRPLQFFVDLVPDNIIGSAGDNRNMLKLIFFALFMGIAAISLPEEKSQPVLKFFESLNDIIIRMIDFIMWLAPFGVFGLMAGMLVQLAGDDPSSITGILAELGYYALAVVIGLLIMGFVVYPLLLWLLTRKSPLDFFKAIMPAQLLAFSTSSSAATLPVTMDRCENGLKLRKGVVSFVLPVGATVNMDGTSLYQVVAAVFIANVYGIDLTLGDQLTIVLTATIASIGSAAVPGAGVVMLVIVLQALNIRPEGVALILAVDRPLDMLRTVINVTGDATVATIVDKTTNDVANPSQ